MNQSVLKDKSKAFAIRAVNLYKHLCDAKKESVLSKQVLRSGTSIGANVAEAFVAQSDADFIAKLYIARKEASETCYWLELLFETKYIEKDPYNSIYTDCEELLKLHSSSILTMKKKSEKKPLTSDF